MARFEMVMIIQTDSVLGTDKTLKLVNMDLAIGTDMEVETEIDMDMIVNMDMDGEPPECHIFTDIVLDTDKNIEIGKDGSGH